MKIVISAYSARVGGGQTYITNLLANLPDRDDLDVHLFTQPDVEVAADPRIRRLSTRWPVTNPVLRALWERIALPRYLRKISADILFCPGGVVNTTAPESCKTVTMFRNMIPFDARARATLDWGLPRLRAWLLRGRMLRSMTRADLTIFISDFARRVIESQVQVPKAVTIPHGVAPGFRTAALDLPRPQAAGEEEYLLYVSRFETYKHHEEVVRAYARLPQQLRDGVRLLLAGETYLPRARRTAALIAQLGLEGRVVLLGGVPYRQLPALYRNARAILFASSCENCPNILLEALGSGRPVLSSDVMPMPEFGGQELSYFSPWDPDSIRAAIERVLSDPAHADALGIAAAARSLKYDWRITADETWRAIIGLIAGDQPQAAPTLRQVQSSSLIAERTATAA